MTGWRPDARITATKHQDQDVASRRSRARTQRRRSGATPTAMPGAADDRSAEAVVDGSRRGRRRRGRRGARRRRLAACRRRCRHRRRAPPGSPWPPGPRLLGRLRRLRLRRARPEERPAPAGPLPEVGRARVVRPGDADAAPGPGQPVRDVAIPGRRPELGLDRVDPPAAARLGVEEARRIDLRAARPAGCPSMNHSVTVSRVHGPGAPPVHASIRGLDDALRRAERRDRLLRASGRGRTPATAAPRRSARSRASRERGFEWSLLPIQSPTAIAGAFGSFGGAR